MDIKRKNNVEEIEKYSYSTIAANLSGYVEVDKKIRLVNSCSYQDKNRSKINLLLLKQFGVTPLELNSSDGKLNIRELENLEKHNGLTILVESIALPDLEDHRNISGRSNDDKKLKNVKKVNFRKSGNSGIYKALTEKHIEMINQQIQAVTQLISIKRQDCMREYIYISGFSILPSSQGYDRPSEPLYLPWYLETGDATGIQKINSHQELDFFLRSLGERPPRIANLDNYLDDMMHQESHD